MEDFHLKPTICSWGTMLIVANSPWRPSACCWRTRSNTQRTSSSCEGTTNVPASTEYMGSMMNVSWWCQDIHVIIISKLILIHLYSCGILYCHLPPSTVLSVIREPNIAAQPYATLKVSTSTWFRSLCGSSIVQIIIFRARQRSGASSWACSMGKPAWIFFIADWILV